MGITAYQFGGGVAGLQLLNGVNLSASLTAIADKNNTPSFLKLSTSNISLEAPTFLSLLFQQTLGTRIGFSASQTVNVPSAGNGVFRMISNAYTINNLAAQTGSITGFYLNATETALNGITHNLMDLQVGGVSRIRGTNAGALILSSSLSAVDNITTSTGDIQASGVSAQIKFGSRIVLQGIADGVLRITNNAVNDFNRIQLGGTTNLFPAIKRNGAAIDFRLADDSAACNINTGNITPLLNSTYDLGTQSLPFLNSFINTSLRVGSVFKLFWYSNNLAVGSPDTSIGRYSANVVRIGNETTGAGNLFIGGSTGYNASAILQSDSTTQGFLMPRMTQAQILLIGTPANGLMVYNTTLNQPCFFDGTIWNKLNHSPM
jgi:hypothetical protein